MCSRFTKCISWISSWFNKLCWQATEKYVSRNIYFEILIKEHSIIQINDYEWQLPMSKCFCKRLWFSLLLQHCFLLCFSWSSSPNYPLPQCSCSIFLFLNVIAAFLWLSPLLSSGSHCFHSWCICFCFPHDIAIGSMMLLALLSNRYPQDRQPGLKLKN